MATFFKNQTGSVSMLLALSLPALLLGGGIAVDFAKLSNKKSALQQLADETALAGARELRLGNSNPNTVLQAATAYMSAAADPADVSSISFSGSVPDKHTVQIKLTQTVKLNFASLTKLLSSQVSAQAIATVSGSSVPICVIGLDQNANFTVGLDQHAKLDATGCAVYSNSKKPSGLFAKNSSLLKAGFTCSAGGKFGGPGNYAPSPIVDCPVVPDPLLSRPAPAVGSCAMTGATISGGLRTLFPGTYCNGLTITNSANVTFSPGIYVFKNGGLTITGGATAQGTYVGLYFTGTGATFNFAAASTISFTAPKTGTMAGMLIFEDRASPVGQNHHILSNNARMLLGTIYVPRGMLSVAANAPVADQSAYTIVVARQFSLSAGPTMVLNTNYSATDIPVPDGLGPINGTTSLTQ
jgi:Flp pilus assembly protein TadG